MADVGITRVFGMGNSGWKPYTHHGNPTHRGFFASTVAVVLAVKSIYGLIVA